MIYFQSCIHTHTYIIYKYTLLETFFNCYMAIYIYICFFFARTYVNVMYMAIATVTRMYIYIYICIYNKICRLCVLFLNCILDLYEYYDLVCVYTHDPFRVPGSSRERGQDQWATRTRVNQSCTPHSWTRKEPRRCTENWDFTIEN